MGVLFMCKEDFEWMDEMANKVVFENYDMTPEENEKYRQIVKEYAKMQEVKLYERN